MASVVSDSVRPHGLQPTRLLCPWSSPGKNTGLGCHYLLQGIFPTQGSKLSLLPSTELAGAFFTTSTTGKPILTNHLVPPIPVGIFSLEAIKIGCKPVKGFSSPLSQPTVLIVSLSLMNFILLSFCLRMEILFHPNYGHSAFSSFLTVTV